MSLPYIRRKYGVPARRGGLVLFGDFMQLYKIRSAREGLLVVSPWNHHKQRKLLHPTWRIIYL